MLTGKQYTLNQATLALHLTAEGKRTALQLPQGAVIKVASGPRTMDTEGVVDVLWKGSVVSIFLVDLQARGEEMTGKSAQS